MKIITFIFLIVISFYNSIISQNYINIENISGDNYEDHISELDRATNELITKLPILFRDSFKVFTFGAYLHLDKFESTDSIYGICKNFANLNSPYYLLIIRIPNEQGLNRELISEIKLPTSDSLHCVLNEHFDIVSSEIEQVILKKYDELNSNPEDYYIAEIEGINYLSNYIYEKVICCDGTGRSQSCEQCYTESALEIYIKNREYDLYSVPSLSYTPTENITTNIVEYAEISMNPVEGLFSINNDIAGIIEELTTAGIDAKVTIDYYTYLGCNRIIKQIGKNTPASNLNPYFYLDILGYNSETYGPTLGLRVRTNLISNKTSGTSTFYILNLDGSRNTENIIGQFRLFLNKATLNQIHIDKIYPSSPCVIGATDAIAILGQSKSKIFQLAMSDESIKNNIKADEIEDLELWYTHPNELNIERTKSSVGFICTATNDLNLGCQKWDDDDGINNLLNNANKYDRLLGFILLHCTAHNSGIHHSDLRSDGQPMKPKWQTEDYGYAAPGYEITQMIKYYPVHRTFEMIIDETVNDTQSVIEKTKKRFGIE